MEHCRLNAPSEYIPFQIQQNMFSTNSLCSMQCSGYQPPEYIDGEISAKFGIFSLGVIMIRIVSGPESYQKRLDMPSDEFIDEVRNNILINKIFFNIILCHIYSRKVSAKLDL